MPNPQLPSLKFPLLFNDSPYKNWFVLANTLNEHLALIETFNGIPKEWVEWAEKKTLSSQERGVIICKPLAYRLNVLWNGIILLQEGKFLCDTIESALRNTFIIHSREYSFTIKDVIQTIPNKGKWLKTVMEQDNNADLNGLVTEFTFGEIVQIIYRNWNKVGLNTSAPGFVNLFFNKTECRDGNLFLKDMSFVRKERNEIAHIKRLFLPNETTRLYKIAQKWLLPLNIVIENKIVNYRRSRPKFLFELGNELPRSKLRGI